jgi:putative hemolysin
MVFGIRLLLNRVASGNDDKSYTICMIYEGRRLENEAECRSEAWAHLAPRI